MKITYHKYQLTAIILLLLTVVISKSGDMFIRFLIEPELQAIEKQYGFIIQYKAIVLKGLNKAQVKGLTIRTPDNPEPVATANSIHIKTDAGLLLSKKISIQQLGADKVTIRFKPDDASGTDSISFTGNDYITKAERIVKTLSRSIPSNTTIHNLKAVYRGKEKQQTVDIPVLKIEGNSFVMEIRSKKHRVENEWICSGTLPEEGQPLCLRLYTKDTAKKIALPFVEEKWGAKVLFDTLALELSRKEKQTGIQTVQGKAGIKGLAIYHELISPDTIVLDRGFINYTIDIGKDFLEIDSSTTSLYLNQLKLNPSIRIEKNKGWRIRAALDKKDFPAEALLSSIPEDMFHSIEGLKAEGIMTYHFFLDVDMANVENLRFESTLQSRNFRILRYGNTDLRQMNNPFSLVVSKEGRPVRTTRLGYENPDFRPYGSISHYLPYAIMHAEDAGFMHHAGFIPEAFERSLAQNITERRFARGGSTLSMQLVKNVFLNHSKTISRKLEEIMIVWLIETCRLTSKQRMFEVYMNIIEWGDNVYGVTEASRYYFAKEPSELNLGECVFLSSIISAPKQAHHHFNGTQIKPAFHAFYRDAVKRMLQRGWITPGEAASGNPAVTIRGPFREKLIK
ncbi:MAG: transglycosylase domain-containing protein, partial [Tannerellaceae bacterium]|nr:transglycosylase domain-containing protein [Tannerellaceae bacterium]